jgi:hypothetical protein
VGEAEILTFYQSKYIMELKGLKNLGCGVPGNLNPSSQGVTLIL